MDTPPTSPRHAHRKFRGPETWALVREAYLAGEPAPQVCARFDVTEVALRRRAGREGWTRQAHAAAREAPAVRRAAPRGSAPATLGETGSAEPAPKSPAWTPAQALGRAQADAARALAEGRAAEALTILKAAEALAHLTGAKPAEEAVEFDNEYYQSLRGFIRELHEKLDEAREQMEERAGVLALRMMSDLPSAGPAVHSHAIYAWRAQHLGPVVAANDFKHGVSCGWAAGVWDREGNLRPIRPAPEPDAQMTAQHVRGTPEPGQPAYVREPMWKMLWGEEKDRSP